jgi:hypothetical protein
MSSRSLMHRVFPPSEPPDGGCSQLFRLVVGGTQLRGSWYLLAIVRLQGFSSVSPAAPLRRRSPETVTTSPWVARSEPGCDLGPTLSFKDVHHPRWGGDRAEPELYLGVRGRGRSLALRAGRTSTTRGWSTAGVVSLSASGSSAWLTVPPPAGRRLPRRVHGRTAQDIARCQGGVRVLGRSCLYTSTTPPRGGQCPTRPGGSEWGSAGGRTAPVVGAEVEAAREVPVANGITATIRASGLRLFVLVLAPRASAWARARLQQRPP